MDVDCDEVKEEVGFVLSAVSDSAGCREPRFMCGRQCRKGGFKFHDTAPLPEMLQFEARRMKGNSDKQHVVGDVNR